MHDSRMSQYLELLLKSNSPALHKYCVTRYVLRACKRTSHQRAGHAQQSGWAVSIAPEACPVACQQPATMTNGSVLELTLQPGTAATAVHLPETGSGAPTWLRLGVLERSTAVRAAHGKKKHL
jgi:hypothetical protein